MKVWGPPVDIKESSEKTAIVNLLHAIVALGEG